MRGGDGASTDVPITPRDASDGRVSGLVFIKATSFFRCKRVSGYSPFHFILIFFIRTRILKLKLDVLKILAI